jgi:hypothetical protein
MHPYYRETYGYAAEDFPVAAGLYPELITLPLYPDMSEDEVGYVCEAIKGIVGKAESRKRKVDRKSRKQKAESRNLMAKGREKQKTESRK